MHRETGGGRLLSRLPVYFWIVTTVTAAADLWTKHLLFRRLPDERSAPIVVVRGWLQIVHRKNYGGVFGLGQGSWMWLAFGLVAAAVVVWFAHRDETRSVLLQIALGLVFAGAVGNLFDRLVFGYVRDFVDVCYWPGKHWPAFNLADAGICVGAAYLAVHAFFSAPTQDAGRKPRGKK